MAEDCIMEFPYAPSGGVRRLNGRTALAEYVNALGSILEIERITDPIVHRTQDPGVVILEFSCIGRGIKTGEPYNQHYISVITLRDGHIVRYLDYWNPLVAMQVIGDVEALPTALKGRSS